MVGSDELYTPQWIVEERVNKRGPRLRKDVLRRGENCAKL